MILALTALAGGLGGIARFLVDTAVNRHNKWSLPLGTFVVNATACLFLGLLTGYALGHPTWDEIYAVLGVGLLGGYSTFSTASAEAMRLLHVGRWRTALVHSGGMLIVSAATAALGLGIGNVLQ